MTYVERSQVNQLRRRLTEAGGPARRTLYRHRLEDRPTLRALIQKFEAGGFVTPKELAERLPKSSSTIYRWIDEGRLQAERIGSRLYIPLDQDVPELN